MSATLAVAIFLGAYGLIATEKVNRVTVALTGAGLLMALRVVSSADAFHSERYGIDWDVIFLLLGTATLIGDPPNIIIASQAYLAGARLLELFPVVPIMGNITLGVGVLSYAGQLNLTAMADQDSCPDLEVFAHGVRSTLDDLARSVLVPASLGSWDDCSWSP